MDRRKIVANGDDGSNMMSPRTFLRHSAASEYVGGQIRNRQPIKDRDRFPRATPGAWGVLSSGGTISGASGVTLGSGSVDLCDSSGTRYSPTETVTVKNAGGSITASAGKILALEWVEGEWTVCDCVESTTEYCPPCPIPLTDLVFTDVITSTTMVLHYDPAYLVSNPTLFWHSDCFALTAGTGNARWVFGCYDPGFGSGPNIFLGLQIFYSHITGDPLPCTPEFALTTDANAASAPDLMADFSVCDPMSIAFGSEIDGLVFYTVTP